MQRKNQKNLFFYRGNIKLFKMYNSVAKSFIKTAIALCNQIEQNEDTESFKNEIMLIVNQEENKGIDRLPPVSGSFYYPQILIISNNFQPSIKSNKLFQPLHTTIGPGGGSLFLAK